MIAVQAVLLPVGDDIYALPVDWVREVVAAPPVTRLVTAPSVVLGLFNLRGEIVPLLDIAALLSIGKVRTTAFAVVVSSRGVLRIGDHRTSPAWPPRRARR